MKERLAVGGFVLAVGVDLALAVRWDEPPVRDPANARVATVADVRGPLPGDAARPGTGSDVADELAESSDRLLGALPAPDGGSPAPPAVVAAGPSTTVAPGGSPTVRPGALRVPVAGSYRIRIISDGQSIDGTLVIDGQQWQRRLVDDRVRSAQQLSWGPTGAILAASGEPGTDGACRWDGPAVAVPSDLEEGRRWSSRTICTSTVAGQSVRVVRREQAVVTKRARTQVAGRSLDTWVIEREVALTIEAETFTTTTVSASSELFAPELGLAVFQATRVDVPMPDGQVRSAETSEELLALPPPA